MTKRIPLSETPIDAAALKKTLEMYEGKPAMSMVEDFEEVLRKSTGAKYVLALNSGTSAIHLALKALGVGPGDCVVAPTFTYVATINPIIYLGAFPVFVDSEPLTWNLDPDLLEIAIKGQIQEGRKPRCVIVVHGYGMPARMDAIMDICTRYEIALVEDAAEAIGSKYKSTAVGSFGQAGVFSFNNNKLLTTYGGGALVTNDVVIYKKAIFWASQSREDKPFYEHTDIGFNYRMGPLNAAAGLVGMKKIDQKLVERRAIYEHYVQSMQGARKPISWLKEPPDSLSNRWLSTLVLKGLKISDLITKMNGHGIECRRLWNPMHLQPYYQKYASHINGTSEQLFMEGMCLPSSNIGDAISASEVILRELQNAVT